MINFLKARGVDYLYHMTHVDHLASILKNGLLSHNESYRQGKIKNDISDPQVQDKRSNKFDPINHRSLHEYVPLYFSPRNPMLSKRREIQEDIIILGLGIDLLFQPGTIFTDGNAASSMTKFYQDTNMLDQLPWDTIMAKYWNDIEDGRRIKCAEILIYPKVEVSKIEMLFCCSEKHRDVIIRANEESGVLTG